jgi:hypothetical protein
VALPLDGFDADARVVDLITHDVVAVANGGVHTPLEGYGVRWLRARPAGDLAVP